MPRSRDLLGEDRAAFAWLLTQDDLDRLPVIHREPVTAAAIAPDDGGEAAEAQADALRAEVARLTAFLDDASAEADRADRAEADLQRVVDERDDARRRLVDAQRSLTELAPTRPAAHPPIELHVAGAGHVTCDGRELLVEYEAARATTTQTGEPLREVVDLRADRCPNPACTKLTHRGPCSEELPRLDDEPHRPRHDWYPDDGVTLSYRELRQLLALHLDRCSTDPDLARAMRDGESPLHLVEVLDR